MSAIVRRVCRAGQSCQAGVSFTPTQVGLRTGYLYVYNPYVGSQTVSLSGTGVATSGSTGSGTVVLSASALNFGTVLQGTTSSTQYLYVYNTGNVPVTITSATAATTGQTGGSDFQVTSACGNPPVQLLPEQSTCIYVTFTPSTSTNKTGTLTLTDSTSGSPHTVALSGAGVAAAQALLASPSNFVFPDQPVGSASAAQTIYIYNTGTDPFIIDRVLVTGDFQITSTGCAETTLNPTTPQNDYANNYCTVNVTFTPTATGSRTGTLSLIDAATGNPQVINLMGNGVAATGSLVPEPDNLVFTAQAKGTTSAGQYISLYNSGNSPVQLNSLAATGDFAISSNGSCSPGSTVFSPGSQCTFYVTFTPMQTSGAEAATVVVGTSAGNYTINLSGTAEAATQAIGLTPTTFNFGTVQKGTTVGYGGNGYGNYYVYVRNTGTENVTFSSAPTITGPNAADFAIGYNYTCANEFASTTSPLAPGTSCAFWLSFTPSTATARTRNAHADGFGGHADHDALRYGSVGPAGSFNLSAHGRV